MTVQLIRKVRDRLPTRHTGIRADYPFCRGMAAIHVSISGLQMVPLLVGTLSSNDFGIDGLSLRPTIRGVFIKAAGGGYSSRVITVFSKSSTNISGFSVFHKMGSASGRIFELSGASGQSDGLAQLNSDGTITITANADVSITSSDTAIDGVNTLVFTNNRSASAQRFFLNGKLQSATGASSSQSGFTFNKVICGEATSGDFSTGMYGAILRIPTDAEIIDWAKNPFAIFESETIPLFFSTVTAQFLRPISDVSNSGWTPSTGTNLSACIGEAVRDDSVYISATAPGAIFETLLGTGGGDPLSSINHLPRIVMSAGSGGIIVRLKQGATVIKTWTYASLTGTDTLYEPTLTSGEIDSITDYTNLRLQMETTA